ncbi:hypothetical protein [Capsulimonas corticalis]|nr:hypothetical protein [Capsulimonas corticalis]
MWVVYAILCAGALVLVVAAKKEVKRSVRKLSECPCPSCGVAYGYWTAAQARERHIAQCEEIQRGRPGYRINFVREWEVECLACGALGYYGFENNRLRGSQELIRGE